MSKFYTSNEVAEILKLAPTTITKYIRAKKLVASKFGYEYRIAEEDLQAFIEANKNTKKR